MEYIVIYFTGALVYGALEVLWRGFTHWTMMMTGGLCGVMLYMIFNYTSMSFLKKMILSAALITTVEFCIGVIVNIILGWHVWDYSSQKYHLLGQICPKFTVCWFLLSIPAFFLCRGIRIIFTRFAQRRQRPV